jgi:hypothetical protein
MVCLRNISVDTLHKGETEVDNNKGETEVDNNNNNNNNKASYNRIPNAPYVTTQHNSLHRHNSFPWKPAQIPFAK